MTVEIDIARMIKLAEEAREIILGYYNAVNDFDIERKGDNSPVTNADKESSDLIVSRLLKEYPGIKVISEESDNTENLKILNTEKIYWLIDPLDGTWSFIKRKGHFAINIALIIEGKPYFGLIDSPLDSVVYYNDPVSNSVFKKDSELTALITPKNIDIENGFDFLVSHKNLDQKTSDFINSYKVNTVTPISSSVKLGLLAEGIGDIYPRFKKTCIWDTASGHALINTIGGDILDVYGNPIRYDKTLYNPDFIALRSTEIKLPAN
jgi:3'(2'), 5'-bisphosphate nucleotidase